VVMLAVGRVIGNDLMGRGKPQYLSYAAAIAAVVTVGLDIALIPQWRIVGAAIASTIGYGVAAAALLWWFVRLTGAGAAEVIIPRYGDLRRYRLRERLRPRR
jgi:Na+-driven multidrug efflux pump